MLVYEVDSAVRDFRYKVWCSQHADGWHIDGVLLLRRGEALLPKRSIRGSFASEAEMIDRAVQWCDALVRHLISGDCAPPDMPAEHAITADQMSSQPDRSEHSLRGRDVA